MYAIEIAGAPAVVIGGDQNMIELHLLEQPWLLGDLLSLPLEPNGQPRWSGSNEDLLVRPAVDEERELWLRFADQTRKDADDRDDSLDKHVAITANGHVFWLVRLEADDNAHDDWLDRFGLAPADLFWLMLLNVEDDE